LIASDDEKRLAVIRREDRAFTEEVANPRVAIAPIRGRDTGVVSLPLSLSFSLSLSLFSLAGTRVGEGRREKGSERRGNGEGGWDPSDLV
jgi:hypothetical protein